MRKFLAIAALSVAGMAGWGCGSTGCDKLQSICDKCTDAATKSSCNSTVSTYRSLGPTGDTDCQAIIDGKSFSSCGS